MKPLRKFGYCISTVFIYNTIIMHKLIIDYIAERFDAQGKEDWYTPTPEAFRLLNLLKDPRNDPSNSDDDRLDYLRCELAKPENMDILKTYPCLMLQLNLAKYICIPDESLLALDYACLFCSMPFILQAKTVPLKKI